LLSLLQSILTSQRGSSQATPCRFLEVSHGTVNELPCALRRLGYNPATSVIGLALTARDIIQATHFV
jgi:hypothetical protein